MNVTVENSIFDENNLLEVNRFLTICTRVANLQELNKALKTFKEIGSFDHLEEQGIRYGFGHNHFWLSELQKRGEWVRLLFIDFSE